MGQAEDIGVNQMLWLTDAWYAWMIYKELMYNTIQLMQKYSNQ